MHLRLKESLPHCKIKELVYVYDEDGFFYFKNLNLVAFKVLSFPISELIKIKLVVLQRKKIILYRGVQYGVHGVREFIEVFKVNILVFQGNQMILFSHTSHNFPPKLSKVKLRKAL